MGLIEWFESIVDRAMAKANADSKAPVVGIAPIVEFPLAGEHDRDRTNEGEIGQRFA